MMDFSLKYIIIAMMIEQFSNTSDETSRQEINPE